MPQRSKPATNYHSMSDNKKSGCSCGCFGCACDDGDEFDRPAGHKATRQMKKVQAPEVKPASQSLWSRLFGGKSKKAKTQTSEKVKEKLEAYKATGVYRRG